MVTLQIPLSDFWRQYSDRPSPDLNRVTLAQLDNLGCFLNEYEGRRAEIECKGEEGVFLIIVTTYGFMYLTEDLKNREYYPKHVRTAEAPEVVKRKVREWLDTQGECNVCYEPGERYCDKCSTRYCSVCLKKVSEKCVVCEKTVYAPR